MLAFAVGLAIAGLLSRREARERDGRRLAELSAELAALAEPAGIGAAEVERAPLCCRDGKCPGQLTRRQPVGAPGPEVVEAYRLAFERNGWRADPPSTAEPGTTYFAKEVGGRRVSAAVRVGGEPASAIVMLHLDAESC